MDGARDISHGFGLSRRSFLRLSGMAVTGIAAAGCAPAAAPPPSAPAPAAGSGKADWEIEWDNLVAAAKKEGKVAVHTPTGSGFRDALIVFEKAFGIEVEQLQYPEAATYVPKITEERKAGIYTFDVGVLPPTSALTALKPLGVYDPLRPLLFRPDVLDDKAWINGYEYQWLDLEKKLAFATRADVNHSVWINTDLVKESEIKTIDDVLKPQFKGKIGTADPRQGAMRLPMTSLRLNGREDAVRRLFTEQEVQIVRDRRQHVEGLIRGRYPIGIGLLPQVVNDLIAEGVGKNVKSLDLVEVDYQSNDVILVFNRAPHPNAAKLFANWLLTREGATAWSTHTKYNSWRKDVPIVDQNIAQRPGVIYKNRNQEEIYPEVAKTEQLMNSLAGIQN